MATYPYPLRLRLASPQIDLREEPYRSLLEDAVVEFNRRSAAVFNPKRLTNMVIHSPSELSIVLDSAIKLETPGRALRLFSQLIAERREFAPCLERGRLFYTSPDLVPAHEQSENETEITDEELLTGLLHFVLGKSKGGSYERKREALRQIKQLALYSGMVHKREEDGCEP